MINKLKVFLEYEQGVVEGLVQLAERQRKALIHYNLSELEQVTSQQAELSKQLRQAEEQRIALLMTWLNIQRKDALDMQMSKLADLLIGEEKNFIISFKERFTIIVEKLTALSVLNRLLANRAKNNVGELLAFLTNGSNHVCNVKI